MHKLAHILLMLSLSSPSILSQTEIELVRKEFQGTWEWTGSGICQRSINGLASQADSLRTILIDDTEIKEFRNDTLFSVSSFQISERTDYISKSKTYSFNSSLYSGRIKLWFKQDDETIHLSISNCYRDGWFYNFKKK